MFMLLLPSIVFYQLQHSNLRILLFVAFQHVFSDYFFLRSRSTVGSERKRRELPRQRHSSKLVFAPKAKNSAQTWRMRRPKAGIKGTQPSTVRKNEQAENTAEHQKPHIQARVELERMKFIICKNGTTIMKVSVVGLWELFSSLPFR